MLYHHSRPLQFSDYQVVRQVKPENINEKDAEYISFQTLWLDPCYRWLEEKLGFYPLFLGVGEDITMTGYQNQFRRYKNHPRIDQVLFSYEKEPPQIKYLDYSNWHIVMNSIEEGPGNTGQVRQISKSAEQSILRNSWPSSRWLKYSQTWDVQAVVPFLDLRAADRVACRSQKVAKELERKGFNKSQIQVMRVPASL